MTEVLVLRHVKTDTTYEIVGMDQEKGTITVKGQLSQWDIPFTKSEKERLKQIGYVLEKLVKEPADAE